MIAVIDYDAGNLKSVEKALKALGQEVVCTRDRSTVLSAERVILPGVGAFGDAMEKLTRYELTDVIPEAVDQGTPFLGICLGLQLLFESSEESPGIKGLGLLPGTIVRFPSRPGYKVPHMGWNRLKIRPEARLYKGMETGEYVYFVHSYYVKADREEDVAAWSDYGFPFHASVERGNLMGCQFHPEKSGDAGLQILRNFIELT